MKNKSISREHKIAWQDNDTTNKPKIKRVDSSGIIVHYPTIK